MGDKVLSEMSIINTGWEWANFTKYVDSCGGIKDFLNDYGDDCYSKGFLIGGLGGIVISGVALALIFGSKAYTTIINNRKIKLNGIMSNGEKNDL